MPARPRTAAVYRCRGLGSAVVMALTDTDLPNRQVARERVRQLTVAVTGASGTVGPTLLTRLTACEAIGEVRVLGRRRTADMPAETVFCRLDVRDRVAVERAVAGADVVVHMAYALYGIAPGEDELFATNVRGTLNVARAAAATGADRFVYLSSAAVYGVGGGKPRPLSETEAIHASARHFYARHKAQAELLVRRALNEGTTDAYLFRPCGIVGPHAAGATVSALPGWAPSRLADGLRLLARLGLRPWLPALPVPLQFVHEDDVAQALALAVTGTGPPGVYNLAGAGVIDGSDAWELLGLRRLPVPGAVVQAALKGLLALPAVVPALHWPGLITEPILIDPTKARSELGWAPRYSSQGALRATREALGW